MYEIQDEQYHKHQCEHVLPSGERCRAKARSGRELCFSHDPLSAAERQQARRNGGLARRKRPTTLSPDAPMPNMETADDVRAFIVATIGQVRCGQLDARVGAVVERLATPLLKSLEGHDLARRVTALERQGRESRWDR